jgi:hypothetical protein
MKGEVMTAKKIDLSEFASPRKTTCVYSERRELLSEEDKQKLDAAMSEKTIPTNRIYTWLKGRGSGVAENTVKRHREKTCCCYG